MRCMSTGINFDPQGILKQYKVLQKVKAKLNFSLLYYPYWVVVVTGAMNGLLVKDRPIVEMMIIDGVRSKIRKIVHYPETQELEVSSDAIFVSNEIPENQAKSLAEAEVQHVWETLRFHPLRPALVGTVRKIEIVPVYKPYWILYNGVDVSPDKLMLVDATTGGSNLPETNAIISKWIELRKEITS